MGVNRVVHFEIHASNSEASAKFYKDVFGWEIGPDLGEAYGHYRTIMTGKDPQELAGKPLDLSEFGINGGMNPRRGPNPAEGQPVNAYVCIVGVDDVDQITEKVKAAGGSVAMEKTPIPQVVEIAYYKDLDGNLFGVLKPVMPEGH